jgi:hypothetical protein
MWFALTNGGFCFAAAIAKFSSKPSHSSQEPERVKELKPSEN